VQERGGREPKEVWKRMRANHYLDCLVLHKAMASWQWKPSLVQLATGAQAAQAGQEQEEQGQTNDGLFTGQGLFTGAL